MFPRQNYPFTLHVRLNAGCKMGCQQPWGILIINRKTEIHEYYFRLCSKCITFKKIQYKNHLAYLDKQPIYHLHITKIHVIDITWEIKSWLEQLLTLKISKPHKRRYNSTFEWNHNTGTTKIFKHNVHIHYSIEF